MSDIPPIGPRVALVAADATSLAALGPARATLDAFAVPWEERTVVDAPAESHQWIGFRAVIVASADAVLPAALAAHTGLPVVRVPVPGSGREGIDLLLDKETGNLPAGEVAFATVAIGESGAKNAALLAVSILGLTDARLATAWADFRRRQTDAVLALSPLDEP